MDTFDLPAPQRLRAFGSRARLEDVLALFDELPPVTVAQMLGGWRGQNLETGHRLDGLLEPLGWHGKRFEGPEDAHPLVFSDAHGHFGVNPGLVPLSTVIRFSELLHHELVTATSRRSLRLLRTTRPRARLRMVEYRGVVTGTMVYDALPVHDHFRLVDHDTLLGAMEARGLDAPLMFVLRREAGGQARDVPRFRRCTVGSEEASTRR